MKVCQLKTNCPFANRCKGYILCPFPPPPPPHARMLVVTELVVSGTRYRILHFHNALQLVMGTRNFFWLKCYKVKLLP